MKKIGVSDKTYKKLSDLKEVLGTRSFSSLINALLNDKVKIFQIKIPKKVLEMKE